MTPSHFTDGAAFRTWLEANHGKARELCVGFHYKSAGKSSITYPEALAEALCYGWIDGVRKNAGPGAYTIRFTPRKAKSYWSVVNIAKAQELIKLNKMTGPGLRAFEARDEKLVKKYSYERKASKIGRAQETRFRKTPAAWRFFNEQAPSYRRVCIWWVVRAVKPETRERRLSQLISESALGKRLGMTTNKRRNSR